MLGRSFFLYENILEAPSEAEEPGHDPCEDEELGIRGEVAGECEDVELVGASQAAGLVELHRGDAAQPAYVCFRNFLCLFWGKPLHVLKNMRGARSNEGSRYT